MFQAPWQHKAYSFMAVTSHLKAGESKFYFLFRLFLKGVFTGTYLFSYAFIIVKVFSHEENRFFSQPTKFKRSIDLPLVQLTARQTRPNAMMPASRIFAQSIRSLGCNPKPANQRHTLPHRARSGNSRGAAGRQTNKPSIFQGFYAPCQTSKFCAQ